MSLASVAETLSPQDSLEAIIARHEEGSIPVQLRREAMQRYEALPTPPPLRDRLAVRVRSSEDGPGTVPPKGVSVTPFRHARAQHAALFEKSFRQALGDLDDPHAALTVALQNSGYFIHVPAGAVIDEPLRITYDASEQQFPYTLVFLGEGAQAVIIEEIVNAKTGSGVTMCGITEVVLEEHARLTYAAFQQSGKEDRVFMTRRAACAADAHMEWTIADLGGEFAGTTARTVLKQPGADAEVAALFFAYGKQCVELTVDVDHLVGPTHSRAHIKSAASGNGQGRAYGNIRIRPAAHGANASLRDDALLLSTTAHIDAVPSLEIAADDVKAYHGAAVGSINEEEMFYAISRGIPQADAERMITLGFFEPIIERFPGNPLRERIRAMLAENLG